MTQEDASMTVKSQVRTVMPSLASQAEQHLRKLESFPWVQSLTQAEVWDRASEKRGSVGQQKIVTSFPSQGDNVKEEGQF